MKLQSIMFVFLYYCAMCILSFHVCCCFFLIFSTLVLAYIGKLDTSRRLLQIETRLWFQHTQGVFSPVYESKQNESNEKSG